MPKEKKETGAGSQERGPDWNKAIESVEGIDSSEERESGTGEQAGKGESTYATGEDVEKVLLELWGELWSGVYSFMGKRRGQEWILTEEEIAAHAKATHMVYKLRLEHLGLKYPDICMLAVTVFVSVRKKLREGESLEQPEKKEGS